MTIKPARLLCVGREINLLRIRCEILTEFGYEAQSISLIEAEDLLRRDTFDLVILSASLNEQEKDRILEVIGGQMPTLQLSTMLLPTELLREVENRLARWRGV
jgi:DNA-binding response OmpR family regulator